MIELHDGREITFDFHAVTLAEWRALFSKDQAREDEDATIAKICGMEASELLEMSFWDYRKLTKALFAKAANGPDPN